MSTDTHTSELMAANARAEVSALTLPDDVTVTRLTPDSVLTYSVRRRGIDVGTIAVGHASTTMLPTGARFATYRFATTQDAVEAVISYARYGYWHKEI